MTFDEFNASLTAVNPPEYFSEYLKALWFDGKNNWDMAHEIAQDINDQDGSWLHAYLHRKEGDSANAGYWYRKAGKPMPDYSLKQEWEEIVKEFL